LGIIRVYLAIAVVIAHMGISMWGVDGHFAVVLFFVISGFYMGLQLNEKYDNNRDFFIARALRLWPSYAVVVFVAWGYESWWTAPNDPVKAAYLWFLTLTMVGYETVYWFQPGFFLSDKFDWVAPRTTMTHMWSVSIEIIFYACAPLIARRPRLLTLVFVAAFALHWWIAANFDVRDPLRHRTALSYFWLFAAGICSYWIWRSARDRLPLANVPYLLAAAVGVLIVFTTVSAVWIGRNSPAMVDLVIILFALSIGPLFQATRNAQGDRNIGELSYAIYLVHWTLASQVFRAHNGDWRYAVLVVVLSVILAAALYVLVDRNVDKMRARIHQRFMRRQLPFPHHPDADRHTTPVLDEEVAHRGRHGDLPISAGSAAQGRA
jgi:peptidoglycan/LPS O-acetylase OafA/YrhL